MGRIKVVTVVGARPQFIKAAAVSPKLRVMADEVLVHTGQHYDRELSAVFFEELGLPPPEVDLGIGSGTHGRMTGQMLAALDPVLEQERPDWVLVYGDTNSTLAGALAAAKMQVPVAHVEAGLRSFNRRMPEEINRVLTDHLARRLYCPTVYAAENLRREGITDGVRVTGDVMDDAVRLVPERQDTLAALGLFSESYYLATVHRQENTDDVDRLTSIFSAFSRLEKPVVLPLHPRTRERIQQFKLGPLLNAVRVLEPQPYSVSLTLIRRAAAVLTDSGGVQRESSAFGVPCYILRDETEWWDLVESGQAVLVGAETDRIVDALHRSLAHALPRTGRESPAATIVQDLVGGLAI